MLCASCRRNALRQIRDGARLYSVSTFSHLHKVTLLQSQFSQDGRRHASKSVAKKTTMKLGDFPQGLLGGEPLPAEPESTGYPTVIQQARNNMRRFDQCVLLTRVGSFYELYFEQAEQIGSMLGLKVASKRTSVGPVPMAGFPFVQLDKYLKILVQEHGKHVAIAEETLNQASEKVKSGGLMFDRQVKRVITPGTLIDEHFLTPYDNNFLLAIDLPSGVVQDEGSEQNVGLAWLDLSSGGFYVQSTDLDTVSSAIARIRPREIIIEGSAGGITDPRLQSITQEESQAISWFEPENTRITTDDWPSMLDESSITPIIESLLQPETLAANTLLQYVQEQLPGFKLRLQAPVRQSIHDYMKIDRHTLRGLEITQTIRDSFFKGSLLHAVRRTATESGARLLAQRLTSPSMSLSTINERLDLVEEFISQAALREEITSLLSRTSDTLRLVQRCSLSRGDAGDLLGLARTVIIMKRVSDTLEQHASNGSCISALVNRFQWKGPLEMAEKILGAIDEEGLSLQQREQELEEADSAAAARDVIEEEAPGSTELESLNKRLSSKKLTKWAEANNGRFTDEEIWIMRRNASPTLSALHEELDQLRNDKVSLEEELRERYAASTLTLKWTPGLGHIAHVKGKAAKLNTDDSQPARVVSSSKSTKSFHMPEWTKLGNRIENTKLRIRSEETALFHNLRDSVITNLVKLRRNAAVLDDTDVACSSAILAEEHNLVRPQLNSGCEHAIHGGRHITVEANLTANGRTFTPNDCFLTELESVWLITGPNMAGKSTFLRQTGLISILAQTGMYVPAAHASIGLVDAVFSRVGSADNLSQDQSTFMVEMLETAHILRHATKRSFVIMDEVGRGTTPEDGVAVGYAVLKHLTEINKCRTLFATHFHKLADLTENWPGVGRWCTGVQEDDGGGFWYDRKLKPGVNWASHALKVARLAGMPESVISNAAAVLKQEHSRED